MKNKWWLTVLLIALAILIGYFLFNRQAVSNDKNIAVTPSPVTTKLALCSNEYYQTEYDEDGKIVIKDFPYRDIEDDEQCQPNEVTGSRNTFGGCCPNDNDDGLTKLCYYKDLSLAKIKDLTCVQKITLSGIWNPDIGTYYVTDCFFENDDLNYLSNLTNLEEIIFDGCGNNNIDNGWWKNLKNLKQISIYFSPFNINDEQFAKILSVISKISTIERVDIRYGMLGLGSYKDIDNLCNYINSWKNIKALNIQGEIAITKQREFIQYNIDGSVEKQYPNCEEWLKEFKLKYEEEWGQNS